VLIETHAARHSLRCLIAEAQFDPAFSGRLHAALFRHSRDGLRSILTRGRDQGHLRPGFDVEAVIDVITGAMWYRLLAGCDAAPCERYAETVVDMLRAMTAEDPAAKPRQRSPALFEP
jgi:Tetracyclin repressor-like, C-terminal domain